jgi:GT2 family glycosyltransferase
VTSVSVVIPNYDGARWLPGLLTSLAAQTASAGETIVVDNASRDGSREWLAGEHPGVRVLALQRNTGFAHAANLGIDAAAGELVALLNPDVELAPDWLARLAARFADPGIVAAAGKMVSLSDPRELYDAGDFVRRDGACLQRGRGRRDDGAYDEPGEVFGACAGAAMYRRAAVLAAGGFDERYFMYLEDADLALALRAAGGRCAYEPAVARHAGGGSADREGAHHPWVTRNTILLLAKWFPLRWTLPISYRQAALLVLAARERRLGEHLRALAAGVVHAPAARRARPRLAVPVEQLVPVAPWRGPAAEGHPTAVGDSWVGHNRKS